MKTIFHNKPNIGLVVGTHGTPSYVHLHLENARRLYPDIPILVHDDCSNNIQQLNAICAEYKVDFDFNQRHLGHYLGDIFIFAKSLIWAKRNGIDLLVKMSRRWLPLIDWRQELSDLALEGQYPTYSSYCSHCCFAFRTECIALHVDSWLEVWDEIFATSVANKEIGLPEAYMHELAKKICSGPGSYVMWPLMGESRFIKHPNVMWHSVSSPEDYANKAIELGLQYTKSDFEIMDSFQSIP